MSDLNNNKLNDDLLGDVGGGLFGFGKSNASTVRPIKKTRVMTTASSVRCRYQPSTSAPIAKEYEYGHILYVDGVTGDDQWYRLLISDPKGGTCYGYINKQHTKLA